MAEPTVVQGAALAEQAMMAVPPEGMEASRPMMLAPPAAPGANLNVLVPPGAAAGQRVEFTAPSGQRLVVVMEQDVAPGSMVGVSLPLPEAAVAQAPAVTMPAPAAGPPGSAHLVNGVIIRTREPVGPTLPQLEVRAADIEAAQDRKAACIGWLLYGAGWFFLFTCGLFAVVPWMVIAGLYYCKTPEQRNHRRRQKAPACASLVTCSVVGACVMAVAVAMSIHVLSHHGCHDWPHHHHHHDGHHHGEGHHHPGPLRGILHRVHHAWHHHHHCPDGQHPEAVAMEEHGPHPPAWHHHWAAEEEQHGSHQHGWQHEEHPGWRDQTGPHHGPHHGPHPGPHRAPPADVEAHAEEDGPHLHRVAQAEEQVPVHV